MLHQFLVVFICFTVALCVSADDNTNLSTPYIKPIQQYVTIVVVPNIMITESWTINPLNGHDTVNFDGAFYNRDNNNHNQLPVVVHVPLDQTDFCEFHNDVFHSEPLQKLCKDFVGSKFPAIMNDPESSVQYDSDEVFFFASISSGKIVDSTKFLLPLTDELHGKQMIIQFYGNWSVLSANEAQALVIDIAGRRELQTYVGAPVRKPRYTSLVVSDTRATQLESPTIVYLPPERTDICFRLKHLFPTAVLMDLCVDAADSIFTFPSVRYDVNEIFLFISNDSSSIESFNQISWPIMDPELGTIFVQCFGQWTGTDAAPVVDFMTNLYRNKQLQTYTGE